MNPPTLEAKISEQKQELILLESRLAPFKAIALEKYPGRWDEAVTKLANDIDRFEGQLKRSQRQIRSLDMELTMEFSVDWKNGEFPDTSKWLWFNRSQDPTAAQIELLKSDGETVAITFRSMKDFKIERVGDDRASMFFRCSAEPRSTIIGMVSDDIQKLKSIEWSLVGLDEKAIELKPIRLHKVNMDLLVNGLPEWVIDLSKEGEVQPDGKIVVVQLVNDPPVDLQRPLTIKKVDKQVDGIPANKH